MKRLAVTILILLAVAACAPVPISRETGDGAAGTGAPATPPVREESGSAGASAALLDESRKYTASGEYAQATASLERAVRIDPGNPWLWLELAEVHVAAGNRAQAESHARKALAVAGGDSGAREAAERLLGSLAAR